MRKVPWRPTGIPYGLILDVAVVLLIILTFVWTDDERVRIACVIYLKLLR